MTTSKAALKVTPLRRLYHKQQKAGLSIKDDRPPESTASGLTKRGALWRREVETLLESAVLVSKPWICFPEGRSFQGWRSLRELISGYLL